MAKQGMKRPERTHTQPKNETAPVPELQGKAKHTKETANPIIAGTQAPMQKVYHTIPMSNNAYRAHGDKPISGVYAVLDNDLARDNLENDIPAADLQDL